MVFSGLRTSELMKDRSIFHIFAAKFCRTTITSDSLRRIQISLFTEPLLSQENRSLSQWVGYRYNLTFWNNWTNVELSSIEPIVGTEHVHFDT